MSPEIPIDRNNPYDLLAEIKQSTVDKLLTSIAFPFSIVENRDPFPGCENMTLASAKAEGFELVELSRDEIPNLPSIGGIVVISLEAS